MLHLESYDLRGPPAPGPHIDDSLDPGEANGVAITGLQKPGTSIPGNEGYPVDGLIRTEAPQLSLHGFGYALANGTYANPFYGDHFVPPGVYAFFSDPKSGKTSEPLVTFTADTALPIFAVALAPLPPPPENVTVGALE